MSIKNNTTSLQSLLEVVNALPEVENLDTEISTQSTLLSEQDTKIAELAEILVGKAGGSNGVETCEIKLNSPEMYIEYVDENQTRHSSSNDEIHKVIKNTFMICAMWGGTITFSGGITQAYTLTDGEDNFVIAWVSGDGEIDFELDPEPPEEI